MEIGERFQTMLWTTNDTGFENNRNLEPEKFLLGMCAYSQRKECYEAFKKNPALLCPKRVHSPFEDCRAFEAHYKLIEHRVSGTY